MRVPQVRILGRGSLGRHTSYPRPTSENPDLGRPIFERNASRQESFLRDFQSFAWPQAYEDSRPDPKLVC